MTVIKLWKLTSESVKVNTGIPQESCISLILYLFYSSNNLEHATWGMPGSAAGGWVDDTYFLARGESIEENCKNPALMPCRAERGSRTHGSILDVTRYKLIHLTQHSGRHNMA